VRICPASTGHDDPSTSWQKKSVHQPEQRALARPVVANQANAPLIKAKRGNGKNLTVRVPNHDVFENGPCGGGRNERGRRRRSAPHPGHEDHQLTPIESSRGSGCIELVLLTFCNPVTSRNTRTTQRRLYRRARLHNAAVPCGASHRAALPTCDGALAIEVRIGPSRAPSRTAATLSLWRPELLPPKHPAPSLEATTSPEGSIRPRSSVFPSAYGSSPR
jgi:hypothetical protein